jgi:hypothetical protein
MRLLLFILLCALLSSCNIYQVVETTSELQKDKEHRYYYENDDIKLVYDFWARRGKVNFIIYNKTSKPIYIDWTKSNLIKNSYSEDYWKDIEYTNSKSESRTSVSPIILTKNGAVTGFGSTTTVTHTVTERGKKSIQIPPQAAVNVNVFDITGYMPYGKNTVKPNKPIVLNYDSTNTPLRFRNYISYTFDKSLDSLNFVDNLFWVEKVIFLTEDDFVAGRQFALEKNVDPRNSYYDYTRDKRRTRIAKVSVVMPILGLIGTGILIPVILNNNRP